MAEEKAEKKPAKAKGKGKDQQGDGVMGGAGAGGAGGGGAGGAQSADPAGPQMVPPATSAVQAALVWCEWSGSLSGCSTAFKYRATMV